MMNQDRWMIWTAALVMAAAASLAVFKAPGAASPDSPLAIDSLPERSGTGRIPSPPPIPLTQLSPWGPAHAAAPAPDWAGFIQTQYIGVPLPHPPVTVRVLPRPVLEKAEADLDGASVRWSLALREVPLSSWMKREPALPEGFVVKRQEGAGPFQVVATLGPQARSFRDSSTEPLRTYHYSIELTGQESDLRPDPPVPGPVVIAGAPLRSVRTPSATRVRLVGGDLAKALLSVETYDRQGRTWHPRTVMASPGEAIGGSGWTLRRLKFDRFTLGADVSDESGADRVLTTKD